MTTDEAIKFFGTKKALAQALDIWPHVISRWGKYPPMARQYELEVKTQRELRAETNDNES